MSLGGSKKLFVNNGFEGRWLIGDNNGVERIMTIGKTGHTLTATGTVEDTYVTFKYNTDGLMEFEYNNVKYYLRCTGTELQLGLDKSLSIASHCIPEPLLTKSFLLPPSDKSHKPSLPLVILPVASPDIDTPEEFTL